MELPEQLPVKPNLKAVKDSSTKQVILIVLISLLIGFALFGAFFVYDSFNKPKPSSTLDTSSDQTTQDNSVLDERRKSDLTVIRRALFTFRSDKNNYPQSLNELVPNYLSVIPLDPQTNDNYYYLSGVDQDSFTLRATLSDGSEYEVTN